jgi:hypothetical protein
MLKIKRNGDNFFRVFSFKFLILKFNIIVFQRHRMNRIITFSSFCDSTHSVYTNLRKRICISGTETKQEPHKLSNEQRRFVIIFKMF